MCKMITIDKRTHRELLRHPRKPSVWKRLGIELPEDCMVFVRPACVLLQYT
jgi:hypothetical protein